jgi:fatty acid desaturase/predicted heme/steroid binding protein
MGKGGEGQQFEKSERRISVEELSQHRTPEDAWLAYKGRVYDVSNWEDHPGGSVIFTHAGDDCTDIFTAFHPAAAMKFLKKFEIGVIDEAILPAKDCVVQIKSPEQKKFEQAYRDLQLKLMTMGMFNSSKVFYAYKIATNVALISLSIYLATCFQSFAVNMIGAVVLGLFWQQCGWLAHDFLHHQVFKRRVYGDLMGIIIGDFFQGFSVQWWKSKHNSHHAVPNLHSSVEGACDGDPDIDTMPILAWTLRMAESARDSSTGRFLIRFQAFFYFPVLLFARLAWAYQSWVFVFGGYGQHSVQGAAIDRKKIKYPLLEKAGLICHYAALFAIMFNMPSVVSAVLYFLIGQMSCGFMLALVFGLGHNGMAVYPADQRPDFWKLQVTTTRNVTSNAFVDWFCGGLQYQVDHHLFPTLPRHNLKAVHSLVESFCKEHGVSYYEADMFTGTVEVLTHLHKVSAEFLKEFPAM